MFRINEELVKAGELKEGHVRITKNAWKMTPQEIKELAGFDIEQRIGTQLWEQVVLTDERRNEAVCHINFAEMYYTESLDEYEQFICKKMIEMAKFYEA